MTLPSVTDVPLSFADYRGASAILLIGNRKTSEVIPGIVRQLQADPRTADLPILRVAHLVGTPRVARRMAEREIRRAHASQHADLRRDRALSDEEAHRLLALGLDWKGEVTSQFGFTSDDAQPLVAILDRDASVVSSSRGPNAIAELLAECP
jgi:hypothetical protein